MLSLFRRRRAAPASLPAVPATLSPPQVKASAAGPLIAFSGGGRAVWSPRDYAVLAREGYAANPVVHRCVRLLSDAVSMLPWVVLADGQRLDTHPLLDLLRRPNPAQGGSEMLAALHVSLMLSGNGWLEAVSVPGRDGPRVAELHVLRADRVKVVPGPDGWPAAYDYTVGGRTHRFPGGPEGAVLHLRLHHPTDDHYGLSPLEAAARAVDIHNATSNWVKALLDNAARPSGALVYEGTGGAPNLTPEQFDRLKTELADHYTGAANAGRPMLLEGGLDWKPMGFSPSDMEFIEARNAAARDIALAFGVPPMLLGLPGDNTYANYQEANRAFARQTVLPLMEKTAAALSRWLAPRFGADVRLAVDRDAIPALLPERDALWSRVHAADVLTVNEKRAALGYPPVEGGDAPPG
ncbi:phage portal protein [Futiania mangrovi]|uniref:Phage portal protein n=1 Tax=Futiania mangrovi TaxID=2959716 RepID=A0A9J6PL09_9PROT|nr:phage portal protein [Futiania mangrovii]MCP1337287.1 phage portal protein [Futiania mangrovii]